MVRQHVKVSKSQKQLVVISNLQKKKNEKREKIILRALRIFVFVFFVHILEELRIPKISFEIY